MDYDYLKDNYAKFTDDVKRICKRTGRNIEDIKLVAISKTFPSEQVAELFKAGHIEFGENKVQELRVKCEELKDLAIKWHLVGHLQTNKVKYIIDIVYLIQSVDSMKLALEIDAQAKKRNKIIDILVQVNTSNEMQKSGCEIECTENLCKDISMLENIRLKGLMTIGKFTDDEVIIRENFRTLKKLFEELKPEHKEFEYLSMGMTSDYEIALEEGANMLRIGSAIFGYRNYL